jgi:hypothetical protein
LGDAFYKSDDQSGLTIWVAETGYGPPWVLFGQAASEAEFWTSVAEDNRVVVQ